MRSKVPSCRSIVSKHFLPPFAYLMFLAAVTISTASAGDASPSPAAETSTAQRAPGLHRQPLALPVPRTFALTHVEPAVYSKALGNDPQRIFEFVRDQIAYESYEGCLRGARGTLLAMAGNSVDRAALLASLLKAAGQHVRFARGKLPDNLRKELLAAVRAERTRTPSRKSAAEMPAALQTFSDNLRTAVERDYKLISDQLKTLPVKPGETSPPVIAEPSHFWAQCERDGRWIDYDPSFADATAEHAYAKSEATFDDLPDSLFHRVDLRVSLEEYSVLSEGDAEPKRSRREVLRWSTKSADISGASLVLTHQPENWKGPVRNVQSAVSSAISATGKIKPVLIALGSQPAIGDAFRQKLPSKGLGGLSGMLGGAGTRNAVPVATAETLEFTFVAPDGSSHKVERELFDLVGKARRADGKSLSAGEVRERINASDAANVSQNIYSLFFTTGAIDPAHITSIQEAAPKEADFADLLRRISLGFAATSDGILGQLKRQNERVIRCYPDSPRLTIVDVTPSNDALRLTIDLRHAHVRAQAASATDAFSAQLLHGVIEGTLERFVLDYLTAAPHGNSWSPVISTSLVFEVAKADAKSVALFPRDGSDLDQTLAADVIALLREQTVPPWLAVAPVRPVTINGVPHYAWWRVDSRSGETIPVTDQGLHQTTTEYRIEVEKNGVRVVQRSYNPLTGYSAPTEATYTNLSNFLEAIQNLIDNGATLAEGRFW